MTVLVLGGSGSGKSEQAERIACGLKGEGELFYLATMRRDSGEAKDRIRRHEALRSGKGFLTLEKPVRLDEIPGETDLSGATVLLECLSNLAANEMFPMPGEVISGSEEGDREDSVRLLCRQISKELSILRSSCKNLVVVSNDVFGEGLVRGDGSDDPFLTGYLSLLGKVNQDLAEEADLVLEVAAGIPIFRKPGRAR